MTTSDPETSTVTALQLLSGDDCSVVVIDLKVNSLELLATLADARKRAARTRRGLAVKHVSYQPGLTIFSFNPLLQHFWISP